MRYSLGRNQYTEVPPCDEHGPIPRLDALASYAVTLSNATEVRALLNALEDRYRKLMLVYQDALDEEQKVLAQEIDGVRALYDKARRIPR